MAYVKNYNPGKIYMDLPTANYIYELPLLSFGDIHGAVNLSLVFNYAMKAEDSDPFNIAAGYKLNLQKRLIMENGIPVKFQDENGKCVDMIGDSFPYTFDDDSQRVLRQTGNTDTPYAIEKPDFSTEKYYPNGMIATAVDKYGSEELRYEYNLDDGSDIITYRNAKTITLSYNNFGLAAIAFSGCSDQITLTHTNAGIVVTQLDSTVCILESLDNMGFSAKAAANRYSAAVHATNVASPAADSNLMIISNQVGSNTINTTSYSFPSTVSYNTMFNQVEITDHLGVQIRVQYQFGKPLYSYEIVNGDANFCGYSHNGIVQMYNTVDSLSATHEAKLVTVDTGLEMRPEAEGSNKWQRQVTDFAAGDANRYFLLTGWIKSNTENAALNNTVINVSCASNGTDVQFSPRVVMDGKWKFFAYKVHMGEMSGNFLYVYPNDGNVGLNDLRLYFPAVNPPASERARMILSEDVLITSQNQIIPIHNTIFTCGSTTITCGDTVDLSHDWVNNYVNFRDLLRYMRNQQKNTNTSEFYYNNGKNVLVSASVPSITVTNGSITDDLRNCCVGKRGYTINGAVITKVYQESAAVLVCETDDKDGVMLSRQRLDSNMDVISATVDGITTTYDRNDGLIVSESVKRDSNNSTLYTRSANYDNYPEYIIATDEYGEKTVYTHDAAWGVLKSVTLPDGTVVTDTFDDDMCAMTKRTFGSASGRSNSLTYSGGNLSALQTGDLDYNFTYENYKLKTIQKNNAVVEEHKHPDNTQTNSYYPSQASALHSTSAIFDKYGKLLEIVGVLKNSYYPRSAESENGVENDAESNGSSLLHKSVDELRGETSEFSYNYKGLLKTKTVTDETDSTDKISEESFVYDSIGRLTSHTATYPGTGFGAISGTIAYKKSATDPSADNRVSNYTYKVNGDQKAYTTDGYDGYNRFYRKETTLTQGAFVRTLTYDKTRVTKVADTRLNANLGTNTYTYDALGRIKSDNYSSQNISGQYKQYSYDQYGQLVRENNEGLDKTFIYEYNDIGNITSVKAYNYTLNTTPSGTPTTTSFGYTNDKLTSFGGSSIAYNSMGYPTSYDGMNATWTRGKLSRLSSGTLASGTNSYVYNYNAYGQRVSKSYSYLGGTSGLTQLQTGQVTGYSKNYYYDHFGRLIAETTGKTHYNASATAEQIVYLYDESSIVGMEYTPANGSAQLYYFQRNLQGDVTAIFDTSGNMVAKYLYDAWGNCTISSETTNYAVANANPIRYRGYYYDDDTGLYYCNARYYSPKWRRFISPDDTAYLDPESVNGLNLYCYCNNDPVNFADPSGNAPQWLKGLAVGLAVVGTVLLIGAITVLTCGVGTLAGTMAGAIVYGAAQGVAIGAAVGAVSGAIVGGIASNWSAEGILIGVGIGLGGGAILGGIAGGFAGASSFTANSAYITQYGGNPKEILSAFKGNPRLTKIKSGVQVNRYWGGPQMN